MCEDIIKEIYKVSKITGSKQIEIVTNHLKFVGQLYCSEEGKKKDDSILTITDAKIWRIEDICNCNEPGCQCNEANFCALDWLHINVYKIVAFSFIK